jgi:hypothetical protein
MGVLLRVARRAPVTGVLWLRSYGGIREKPLWCG